MHEPSPIAPRAFVDEGDAVVAALDLIGRDGIEAIGAAFAALGRAGLDPAGAEGQPVLIEAVFHLLERLERDPATPLVPSIVLRLDPMVAAAAAELLLIANFPQGSGDLADLGDGTVLLLAALRAAAGARGVGRELLREAQAARPAARFQAAAIQLRFLLQDDVDTVVQLLFEHVLDGLDHPEIWSALPVLIERFPALTDRIVALTGDELGFYTELWGVLHALCVAAGGDIGGGLALLEPLATAHSQSTMVQGAMFHLQGLLDPDNPAYDLSTRFCETPFDVLDVLDGKSHLCCASWLPESVGDLADQPWQKVWNSDSAQSIRASILDGSFRFCNKTACPKIVDDRLPTKARLASESDRWRDVIANFRTRLPEGPKRVNLAYDQTCNLSCPSCRTGKVAADSATRARFDRLQEEQILPLLRQVKLVLVTGSGDPFASKNFRALLERLGPDDYPELRFQVMTNGMLLTPREWERFPALHGRTTYLRISLDAATGPTHELLRRGARWPVMERNLAFAGELRAQGLVERLELSFTVQVDNYLEMGDAVDLAHRYGADSVAFTRMTNWGTFSADDYAAKAVFMPSHPQHADFVERMQDPRLRDPVAALNDMSPFVRIA
ncbi:radical SAM protein [Sphingomonas histidinilytica]|uniref:radical SAM protein n=1 Tax=Rhizorhabdus histidinilytica TaxID=439228 RepID=UPI001ADB4FC8|nr:radical SAM protein [Rhizorhabdus histidinilytica]MBO9377757.1 radical SAM protein [Rhizorhabdus histidinilytica]